MATTESLRKAAVAGVFYPDDPNRLTHDVDAMLNAAPDVHLGDEVVGLVCPHAGYAYSGPTAAVAYRQVRGQRYDAVIVIAPSHRESFQGASVFATGMYETPLGAVPVATDLAEAIVRACPGDVVADWAGHRVMPNMLGRGFHGEHAIEVQVPFLQRAIPGVQIVPMVVGHFNPAMCCRIGNAIANATGSQRVLVVVSSDLYHGEDDRACEESDERTLSAVVAMDAKNLAAGLQNRSLQACGGGPMLIALRVAERLGVNKAQILAHTHSNAVTGKRGTYVVGYGAVAFIRA